MGGREGSEEGGERGREGSDEGRGREGRVVGWHKRIFRIRTRTIV